jgi:glycosyltransferase involved in cell wall biosynthesis
MKICYIGDGCSIHTQRWVSFFAKRGHEVFLLTDNPEDIPGVQVIDYKLHRRYFSRPYIILNALKLKNLILEIKPHVLHSHFAHVYGWYGAFSGFKPFLITAWGSDIYFLLRRRCITKEKLYTQYALRKANIITGDSKDLLEASIQLGAKREKTRLIQFGVDSNLFRPHLNSSAWRSNLNIEEHEKVVFSPRQMTDVYNIDVIIKAFYKVQAKCSEKVILLLKNYLNTEDAPYINEMKRLICDLGISEKVRFVGKIPYSEMPFLYNLADVVVSISSSDGTPMSVLEAMACGSPLVVSNLPSLREWIKHDWNGYIVSPKDEIAVGDAILHSLQMNPQELVDQSAVNRKIIFERADHIKNMEQVEDIYKSLL